MSFLKQSLLFLQMTGMKEVERQLAGVLLYFIKIFVTPTKEGIELDVPLSREDMANHIGTSRETVSRKLSMMQDKGMVELSGSKTILIRDISYLETICS